MTFTLSGETLAKPNRRNSSWSWSRKKALRYWCQRNKSGLGGCFRAEKLREKAHEHDYSERRHDNLLQRLGRRACHHLFPWLAAELRCVGQPAPFLRTKRFPGCCARPPWSRPIRSVICRKRHGWIRRR